MINFNTLPPDIARSRILDSKLSSEFLGLSLPHFRRLYRAGKVPKPMLIGERKYGWRIGDLVDWLATRAEKAAA